MLVRGRARAGRRARLPAGLGANRRVQLSRNAGGHPRGPRNLGLRGGKPARHDRGFGSTSPSARVQSSRPAENRRTAPLSWPSARAPGKRWQTRAVRCGTAARCRSNFSAGSCSPDPEVTPALEVRTGPLRRPDSGLRRRSGKRTACVPCLAPLGRWGHCARSADEGARHPFGPHFRQPKEQT